MRTRLALVLACVGALACTPPDLADSASPGTGWPDLADPPVGREDGRADAALIVAIEDPRFGGRPGATQVAAGWWRYLVHTRGLRASRVTLLREGEATAAAMIEALDRMEFRAGEGALLWLVFIGQAESRPDHEGLLTTAAGTFAVAELRETLGFGFHESAFVLLDACAEAPAEGWSSGIAAAPLVPAPSFRGPEGPSAPEPSWSDTPSDLASIAASAGVRAEQAMTRRLAVPRNLFVLTAGVGPRCPTELAGRPWPALAYAGLAGLQGWADRNGDGWVGAVELGVYAQSLIAGLDERERDLSELPELDAAGIDLILADLAGLGPRPAPIARARRDRHALDPGEASQTDDSLARADALIELAVEDMIAVPPGRFWMGCDPEHESECERDEKPARIVELGGYAIDRREVSWADWRECHAAGECPAVALDQCWVWTGLEHGFVLGAQVPAAMLADDHPVMCVTWSEAFEFCEALGKRLPSEAEWERAARGVDRRIHPWGDEPPNCTRAVADGCSDFSEPVGSKPAGASPVGALDMAGNVAEWVYDWWDEHSYGLRRMPRAIDPHGPKTGEVRGVRGGSFYAGASDLRTSYRYGFEPGARTSIVGFRCAR
ncbi:formylglycine-generating enzyme family protein [Nannocystaceae bacterium ST9]